MRKGGILIIPIMIIIGLFMAKAQMQYDQDQKYLQILNNDKDQGDWNYPLRESK